MIGEIYVRNDHADRILFFLALDILRHEECSWNFFGDSVLGLCSNGSNVGYLFLGIHKEHIPGWKLDKDVSENIREQFKEYMSRPFFEFDWRKYLESYKV